MNVKELRIYQTDDEGDKVWTTVYSDMVTNLMLFFLMLYGLTRISGDAREMIMKGMEEKFRGKTAIEAKAEKVMKDFKEEEAATRVSALMEKEGANAYTSVEVNEKQIKITLNMPVLFSSGDAVLAPATKRTLAAVARIIGSVKNKIIVEGYTDNVPIKGGAYDSNWALSVARAYSVIEYFSKEEGIDAARFVAAGYGEYKPVASNDTAAGRAKNRRIELVMIR